MRIAEMDRGSICADFIRLNVSRHEIPVSTRMRAFELSTTAVLPRLPLARIESETPMLGSIHSIAVETGVTIGLSSSKAFHHGTTETREIEKINSSTLFSMLQCLCGEWFPLTWLTSLTSA